MSVIKFTLFISFNFYLIACDTSCEGFRTCGKCIGFPDKKCAWCSDRDHEGYRCQSASDDKSWCKEVYNPVLSATILANDDFSNGGSDSNVVQLRPQKAKIRARPGVPYNFELQYKPSVDYPLDVYYLIDYSDTMKNYLTTLKAQGSEIYQGLKNLTNNVQLGIGSFVEKPALPFADPNRHNAYSFKNRLKLTTAVDEFISVLDKGLDGSNQDEPEATLDALMQTMVCQREIGWRNDSRKIIVVTTDSTYHIVGDGRYVGAIVPNDMKCHMVNNNYEQALIMDYPSVSQINIVAKEKNIKIIFNVLEKKAEDVYKRLAANIQGATHILANKTNAVDMIKEEYLTLVRSVTPSYKINKSMNITLGENCSKNDTCKVRHNETVTIPGTLKLKSCPDEDKYTDVVEIGLVGLKEKFHIEFEMDCKCDCEKEEGEKDSEMCDRSGSLQCGICKCNLGRYGDTCQCSSSTGSSSTDLEKCKFNNITCSGNGVCRCGKCDCQETYKGDYCQWNDNRCPRVNGMMCANHGKCQFDRCICDQGWLQEDDCRCPSHDDDCKAPFSNQVCFGQGTCVCGQCECNTKNSSEEICSGTFCENCDQFDNTVVDKWCKELENYAECNYFNNKTICDEKYKQNNVQVTKLNKTEISTNQYHSAKWCRKELNDNILVFRYYTLTKNLHLLIQNELETPIKANIWITVGSAVGAVVLLGLLTVIAWKVLVDYYDEREYKVFVNESTKAGYVVPNPHYRQPQVQFSNPTFSGSSDNQVGTN